MERLTDKELAKALKSNCEGLKRAGIEPNMSDLRYIKLAEYENREERREFDRFYTLKYGEVTANQVAATKYALENRPRKAGKVNLEQIVECAYLLDNEPDREMQAREKAQKISELFGGTFEAYKDGEKWDTESPVRSIVFDRDFKLIKCTLECGANMI